MARKHRAPSSAPHTESAPTPAPAPAHAGSAQPAPSAKDPYDTPAMRQYRRFKLRHPDCLLLFRMGDFYELFGDDAVTIHRALGLTLTQRQNQIPMAGVPYHQLENYLRRLIDRGFRVAVCDQLQDPKDAKGIVERGVTRVLTPGTLIDDALVASERSVRVAAVLRAAGADPPGDIALASVDVATGRFDVVRCSAQRAADELARWTVQELLVPADAHGEIEPWSRELAQRALCAVTPRPSWQFEQRDAREQLCTQFGVATLAGFGLHENDPLIAAGGALIRYVRETQAAATSESGSIDTSRALPSKPAARALAHLQPPRVHSPGDRLVLDAVSLRALEVERTIRASADHDPGQRGGSASAGLEGSLLGVFLGAQGVGCATGMGRRTLADWLRAPLASLEAIHQRQGSVAALAGDGTLAAELARSLEGMADLARIAGRLALGRCSPRDVLGLGGSLARVPSIVDTLRGSRAMDAIAGTLQRAWSAVEPAASAIVGSIVDDPPAHARDGGVVRDGVDTELDRARLLQRDAGQWLGTYQAQLTEQHPSIPGLKVGYNSVFGYYIELSSAQARSAPPSFVRQQTLKNAERYTTPQLREFERDVMTARARALDRERQVFDRLCEQAAGVLESIVEAADAIAQLDALLCMAATAGARGWCRPSVVGEAVLDIRAGRHPVLERTLRDRLVPNDCTLGSTDGAEDQPRLALITGPNMGGKSTYIRQNALIVLLAHAGSFVPADAATVGLCDRVFTRVGADDALHAGQSTFMIEMVETASILAQATDRSLVVLDEIGRGTSTLDGLSLAWAIAEHLAGGRVSDAATAQRAAPRCLFATHYHEITALADHMPQRVRNLHVLVREWGGEIVFLHQIRPGRAERSYGLHVARLAGVPQAVVERASALLDELSVQHAAGGPVEQPGASKQGRPIKRRDPRTQPTLFDVQLEHPVVEVLRRTQLDSMSPMQAFDTLRAMQAMAQGQPRSSDT